MDVFGVQYEYEWVVKILKSSKTILGCEREECICINTPYEEPKQETLEEAAELYSIRSSASVFQENHKIDFIAGAKWQQEKSYNELFEWLAAKDYLSDKVDVIQKEFEQFKSK